MLLPLACALESNRHARTHAYRIFRDTSPRVHQNLHLGFFHSLYLLIYIKSII